jgi:uncharacterized protein YecE (DUF72 family)
MSDGTIRIGIGGWTYEPWRGTFYPEDLPKTREMDYAIARMTAIEINATYYGSQKPATFARWAKAAPDAFIFAVKGSRYCTNRKILADAGESVQRFVNQGIVELGDRLGPILWQFLPTKPFEADDFAAFLALLPHSHAGVALRHAVQGRHESFATPEFVAVARAAGVAIVFADHAAYPGIADPSGDFIYARLENAREEEPTGYAADALDRWAEVARTWAGGGSPDGLPYAAERSVRGSARDVFVFMINGAKVRAPAAAMALAERLQA